MAGAVIVFQLMCIPRNDSPCGRAPRNFPIAIRKCEGPATAVVRSRPPSTESGSILKPDTALTR